MNIPDNIYANAREMETDGSLSPSAAFEYVAEWARKEALREVADHFDQPRILWSGDEGVRVLTDDARLTLIPISQWLRERAEAV